MILSLFSKLTDYGDPSKPTTEFISGYSVCSHHCGYICVCMHVDKKVDRQIIDKINLKKYQCR